MEEPAPSHHPGIVLSGFFATLFRCGFVASLTVATGSSAARSNIVEPNRSTPSDVLSLVGPRITSPTDWWLAGVGRGRYFRLERRGSIGIDSCQLALNRENALRGNPGWAHTRPWLSEHYWHVDFNEVPALGGEMKAPEWLERAELPALTAPAQPRLSPYETLQAEPSLGLTVLLEAPRPIDAPVALEAPCAPWLQPRPVSFEGLGGEGTRTTLVDCDGVVTQQAIERLSVLGRQVGTPAPALPLPPEPSEESDSENEWVPGVHLLHPRLLAQLQQIALAFPLRSIALYSGYRRDARSSSPHRRGRAVDIEVKGVTKESLFAFCRTLHDAGCGYYVHQPFVHVDVRSPNEGSVYWVDAAEPGHPSVYVDSWPGVVSSGALESPGAD